MRCSWHRILRWFESLPSKWWRQQVGDADFEGLEDLDLEETQEIEDSEELEELEELEEFGNEEVEPVELLEEGEEELECEADPLALLDPLDQLDQPYSQFLTASRPDHPDHADHAWCGVQSFAATTGWLFSPKVHRPGSWGTRGSRGHLGPGNRSESKDRKESRQTKRNDQNAKICRAWKSWIYIYKRYKVVRMCSLAAESSEPMTSLVDQSYTFYLRPFLRHPQRCMVWKQGNSLYNQRYQTGIPSGAEWQAMQYITAYTFAAIEEQPVEVLVTERVQRCAIAKLQHGKERPATASLVPAARISKARRVHFVEHGMPEISAIRRNPAKGLGWCRRRVRLLRLLGWFQSTWRRHEKKLPCRCVMRILVIGVLAVCAWGFRMLEAHCILFIIWLPFSRDRIEKVQGKTPSWVRPPLCKPAWRLETSNTVGSNCNFAHRIAKAPRRGVAQNAPHMWRAHRMSSRQLRRLHSKLRDAFPEPIDPELNLARLVQDPEKQPSLKARFNQTTRGRCCSSGPVCYVCLGKLCSVHSLAMPWWSLMPPWHASLSEDFCRHAHSCAKVARLRSRPCFKSCLLFDRLIIFNLFNLNELILLELDVIVTGLSSSPPL